MSQYYLDIETTGFNPKEDKIITIQFQELDSYGKPYGKINIYKEWEMGEEALITHFHNLFMSDNVWSFIPICTNHIFDLTFLFEKFRQYKLKCPNLSDFLYKKPLIDIKYMLIMANNLSFRGSGLDQMTNKTMDGSNVPEWYNNKEYGKIEEYIQMEANAFIEFFQKCLKNLPGLIKCNTIKKSM